ncbi:MAG: polysaccharide biosynthesis protein [Candidatus Moduliflexus flocculans]|nr:polysaccharide biosynthesis protein [Candidatus Moduliflexus flocculans]
MITGLRPGEKLFEELLVDTAKRPDRHARTRRSSSNAIAGSCRTSRRRSHQDPRNLRTASPIAEVKEMVQQDRTRPTYDQGVKHAAGVFFSMRF